MARPALSWSETSADTVVPSSSGVSPVHHHDRAPRRTRLRTEGVDAHPDRVPGALLGLLDGEQRARHLLEHVRPDLLATVAHDGDDPLRGAPSSAACRTCPTIERPPTGCSTFMVLDFIRVPLPAASTMTAAGPVVVCEPCSTCSSWGSGSRTSVAPRVGVEPTSLILIQSQAGPAGRPTGECLCAGQSAGRPRPAGQGSPARQTNRGMSLCGPVCRKAPPGGTGLSGPADQPGNVSVRASLPEGPARRDRALRPGRPTGECLCAGQSAGRPRPRDRALRPADQPGNVSVRASLPEGPTRRDRALRPADQPGNVAVRASLPEGPTRQTNREMSEGATKQTRRSRRGSVRRVIAPHSLLRGFSSAPSSAALSSPWPPCWRRPPPVHWGRPRPQVRPRSVRSPPRS